MFIVCMWQKKIRQWWTSTSAKGVGQWVGRWGVNLLKYIKGCKLYIERISSTLDAEEIINKLKNEQDQSIISTTTTLIV